MLGNPQLSSQVSNCSSHISQQVSAQQPPCTLSQITQRLLVPSVEQVLLPEQDTIEPPAHATWTKHVVRNRGWGTPTVQVPTVAGAAVATAGLSASALTSSARQGKATTVRLQQVMARTTRGCGLMVVSFLKKKLPSTGAENGGGSAGSCASIP